MSIFFDDKPLGERAAARNAFLSDAEQYFKIIGERLLEAEAAIKAGRPPEKPTVNEIFRSAHNIKSMAGFTNMAELTEASHALESALAAVRQENQIFDQPRLESALTLADRVERITRDYAALGEAGAAEFAAARGFTTPPPDEAPQPASEPAALPAAPAPSAVQPASRAINPAMLAKFVEDAENGIEKFNEGLLKCEHSAAGEDLINELFRVAHNLKSTAGFIGAAELAHTAHAMEDLLAHFRKTVQSPDAESVNILFEGIDLVRDMVQFYKAGATGGLDVSAFLGRLNARYETVAGAQRASVAAASRPAEQVKAVLELTPDTLKSALDEIALGRKIFKITADIPASVPVKSINAVMAAKKLSKKGRIILSVPDPESIVDSAAQAVTMSYIFAGATGEEEIRNTLKLSGLNADAVEELTQDYITGTLSGETASGGQAVAASIRVDARKLDRLMDLSGELVTLRSRLSNFQKVFYDNVRREREAADTVFNIKEQLTALRDAAASPYPDFEVLLQRMEQIDAQIDGICHNRQENAGTEAVRFDGLLSELSMISGKIQNSVMSSRMVSIEGVFSRFKRIVRDVAKAVNKDVTLVIEGQETELDKTIVDSLTEPLTHMVRNAVDHGLESAEARRAAGKSERGTICLRAYRMGSSIRIEVRDDGRGMDPDKLAASAISKGVITEAEAACMDRTAKLSLIFKPGFSTAETVTGISGRGVGMDVVMSMIKSVKGDIDIETTLGRGTTFVLNIPLTLSVIKALLCMIDKVPYALPIDSVTETALVSEDQFAPTDGGGLVFARRQESIPFCNTQELLGIDVPEFDQGFRMVAVLNDGGRKAGMAVHKMLGEEELVIKPLPKYLAHLRGIAGVSVLGSGAVAYILDPVYIISMVRK